MKVEAVVELSDADVEQLAAIVRCSPEDLASELKPFAAAALTEYVELVLGRRVFTRGSDMREYRLLLLIKHRYRDHLPTEEEISALFQTSTTQSRALLRAVTSKYQYELSQTMNDALKVAVGSLVQDGGDWRLDATSEFIVEALNRRVGLIAPGLPRLVKTEGTASRYIVKNSTRDALRAALGVQ